MGGGGVGEEEGGMVEGGECKKGLEKRSFGVTRSYACKRIRIRLPSLP